MKKALALLMTLALAACGGGGGGNPADRPGLVVEKLGTVPGPGGCGVPNAVRVTSAAGVQLSQPATLTRATTKCARLTSFGSMLTGRT